MNAAGALSKDEHALHRQAASSLAARLRDLRNRVAGLRDRQAQVRGATGALPEVARRAALLRDVVQSATRADRQRVWAALIAKIDVDFDADCATVHVRALPVVAGDQDEERAA